MSMNVLTKVQSANMSKCVFVSLALECSSNESFVVAGFFMLINQSPTDTHQL